MNLIQKQLLNKITIYTQIQQKKLQIVRKLPNKFPFTFFFKYSTACVS